MMTVAITHKSVAQSVAQHFEKMDERFLHSFMQHFQQHFESVTQHFFMTLKVDIHIIYNVCPILGTYKSVAQHSRRKDTRIMYPLFQSGFNNFNPNRRRTLTDRPARHVFFLF